MNAKQLALLFALTPVPAVAAPAPVLMNNCPATILGVFLALFGAMLLIFAFYLLDEQSTPIGLRYFAWGLGALAFLLLIQGTILALTGNWFGSA